MADEVEVTHVAEVTKGGLTPITATLSRNKFGTSLRIKAIPEVERFMASLSTMGEPVDVRTMGRYWEPLDKDPADPKTCKRLMAYRQDFQLDPISAGDLRLNLDALGQPISSKDMDVDRYRTSLNLSFLRLVGISEGAGVRFGVKGVFSMDELVKLHDQLAQGLRTFYIHYMRPVDLTVHVSTQVLAL